MTSWLEKTLRSDQALASLEETLIRRARELYRLGFSPENLTPSQIAAAGECLRIATDHSQARQSLESWMNRQLAKLREEERRKGRARSWLARPKPGAGEDSLEDNLGAELLAWVREERYLGDEPPEGLDRLAALRRFWERFHGLYRYQNEIQEEMPLSALDLQKKGDEPR